MPERKQGTRQSVIEKMVFRRLRPEERILTRPLYEQCFPEDEKAFVDYYYGNRADRNEIFAAIIQDGSGQENDHIRIVSMVHVNPVKVSAALSESTERADMILPFFVAVATDKNFRRQGLMRRLMELAMEYCAGLGMPFGFLLPANEAYYLPLGFESVWNWQWEENACGLDAAKMSGAEMTVMKMSGAEMTVTKMSGAEMTVTEMTGTEYEDAELETAAAWVNRRLAENYDLFSVRSAEYYRDLRLQQRASGGDLVRYAPDEETCCMICTAREEFPRAMARVLNREAYEEMIGRPLRDLRIMISEVV